jgi:polyphosphate:AMP phosphotransferase
MLKRIDLSQRVEKNVFKTEEEALGARLAHLQRDLVDRQVPVMVVFEGWDAAGKGRLINHLINPLDPRGFHVYTTRTPSEEERLRPFLWRFWNRTPARGQIVVFDRSWYRRVLIERVAQEGESPDLASELRDISAFERQLTDDGCVIVKLFLHISKREQKRRLLKLEGDPSTAWRVTKDDWRRHRRYAAHRAAAAEVIARTGTAAAPWTVVEAEDWRFAALKTLRTVVAALESAVRSPRPPPATSAGGDAPKKRARGSILRSADLSATVSDETYQRRLDRLQDRLRDLHHELYARRIPAVIVFEGWDAAGKGGTIRRLTRNLDPRGYEVVPISAPTETEKAHHYLRRFWARMPKGGHITIFDRSWYGRVMVERVEGFCTPAEWRRAYREIDEMEAHLVASGAVLLKFWLHLDRDEQLRRFRARQSDPEKRWKITAEDWRNRRKWARYEAAVEQMLLRTSPPCAPWTVVESNCKQFARLKVLEATALAMARAVK